MPHPGSAEVISEKYFRRFQGGVSRNAQVRNAPGPLWVSLMREYRFTPKFGETWINSCKLFAGVYSSVLFRLRDSQELMHSGTNEHDPRLTLEAKRETRFMRISLKHAKFLRILGITLMIIFSLGRYRCNITMYAAVAN
jgi:hypothetical protein